MGWEVQDIDEALTVEPVTEKDVQTAEQEAAEAEALIGALEQKVIDGDESVTVEQIEQQRGLSRFAKLRAAAAQRKAERHRQAARLRACDELRREVEESAANAGKKLAKLLRDAEKATRVFVEAMDERNRQLYGWHQRATELEVPVHTSPLLPPKCHAHLGRTGNSGSASSLGLIAGNRHVSLVDPVAFVQRALSGVLSKTATGDLKAVTQGGGYETVYEDLEKVDKVFCEPSDDMLFYRGGGGGLHVYGHEPTDLIERGLLTPVSRKQIRRELEEGKQ